VNPAEILPTVAIGAACVALVTAFYRPLVLSAVAPELAAARGTRPERAELLFLLALGAATTTALPVVGALLVFSLMIGPPAAARSLTRSPVRAMAVSALLALLTVWASIVASFWTNWPLGFFVGTMGAIWYAVGRIFGPSARRGRVA